MHRIISVLPDDDRLHAVWFRAVRVKPILCFLIVAYAQIVSQLFEAMYVWIKIALTVVCEREGDTRRVGVVECEVCRLCETLSNKSHVSAILSTYRALLKGSAKMSGARENATTYGTSEYGSLTATPCSSECGDVVCTDGLGQQRCAAGCERY